MNNTIKSEYKLTFPIRVLVVSDDLEVAQIWAYSLEKQGLSVELGEMGTDALQKWQDNLPDLVVVDSHAWQAEDIEFCRALRSETVIPILLFTSQNDEYYLLEAYKAGVDEVVAQPISPRLFLAKIRAWLRRAQNFPASLLEAIHAGSFILNEEHRLLTLPNGEALRLTHLEARLLYVLMSHPNKVYETSSLIERVWGHYGEGDAVLLKNLIYRLRRKIEFDPAQPCYLLTEGNFGYRFRSGEIPTRPREMQKSPFTG
jgi:DNA-binding response OmpR family regulator